MAHGPGEMPFLGPAAVAVHDDGDVAGKSFQIELAEELSLFSGDRTEGFGGNGMERRGHDAVPEQSSLRRKVNTGKAEEANGNKV